MAVEFADGARLPGRLREFRDSNLPSLEQQLFSSAPVYKNFETVTLSLALKLMQEALGPEDPVVKAALSGKSPDEAAKLLIAGTRLEDVAFRKQLYEGGKAAIAASNDPLIVLMRNVDPGPNAYQKPDNRGGMERTNDVVFSNDGKTMYVVDYGELYIDYSMPSPFFTTPKSGVIWKVTYTGR